MVQIHLAVWVAGGILVYQGNGVLVLLATAKEAETCSPALSEGNGLDSRDLFGRGSVDDRGALLLRLLLGRR